MTGSPQEIVTLAGDLLTSAGAPDAPWATMGRDLLVCTHGSRDRCCGSLGTKLERTLPSLADGDSQTRVWRTSHTGGHRFAPTALLLPEGSGWGYLDESVLDKILHRSGPVEDVLPHYRGCAGLSSPRIQALERTVLAEVGWGLLDCPRHGSEERDGTVRLTVSVSHGRRDLVCERRCRTGPPGARVREADRARGQDSHRVRGRRTGASGLNGPYEDCRDVRCATAS